MPPENSVKIAKEPSLQGEDDSRTPDNQTEKRLGSPARKCTFIIGLKAVVVRASKWNQLANKETTGPTIPLLQLVER